MGFWKSKRGIIGDSWADELDGCIKRLSKLKAKSYSEIGGKHLDSDDGTGHEITSSEFADLIEFCTSGYISCDVLTAVHIPLSQLHQKEPETEQVKV